jgi:hypothetical protein
MDPARRTFGERRRLERAVRGWTRIVNAVRAVAHAAAERRSQARRDAAMDRWAFIASLFRMNNTRPRDGDLSAAPTFGVTFNVYFEDRAAIAIQRAVRGLQTRTFVSQHMEGLHALLKLQAAFREVLARRVVARMLTAETPEQLAARNIRATLLNPRPTTRGPPPLTGGLASPFSGRGGLASFTHGLHVRGRQAPFSLPARPSAKVGSDPPSHNAMGASSSSATRASGATLGPSDLLGLGPAAVLITGLSDRIEHLQQEGIADRIAYEKSHERALQHMVTTQAATEERFKAAETLNASLLQSMSDLRASMRPQHGNAGVFMGNRPPSSVDREDDSDMNLRHNAMPDRYSDMAVAVDSRNASPAATLAATPGYEMTGQFNASAPATGLRGRQSTEVDRRTTLMPFATPHSLRSSDLPRSVTDGSSIKVTYCSTKKGQSAKLFVKQFEEQAKFVNINLYGPMLLSKCDLNVQSTARRAGDTLPPGRYGVLNHAGATVPVPAG